MPAQILPMLDDAHQQLAAQDAQATQQYRSSLLQLQQNKMQLDAQTEQQLNPLRQQAIQAQLQRDQASTAAIVWSTQQSKDLADPKTPLGQAASDEANVKNNYITAQTAKLNNENLQFQKDSQSKRDLDASTAGKNWADAGKAGVDAFNSFLAGYGERQKTAAQTALATGQASEITDNIAKAHQTLIATLATEADPEKREIMVNSAQQNNKLSPIEAKQLMALPVGDYSGVISKDLGPMAGMQFKSIDEQIKNFRSTTDNTKSGTNQGFISGESPEQRQARLASGTNDESKARQELTQLYAQKAQILKRYLDVQDLKKADFSNAMDVPQDAKQLKSFQLYKTPDPSGKGSIPSYFIDGKFYDARDPKTQKLITNRPEDQG